MRGRFAARLAVVVLALIALAATAAAQARTLDFATAYRAALAQDARLRAARHAADAGREALPLAQARLRPEVSASIAESEVFGDLQAPIRRLCGLDTPIPYSPKLERASVPQVDDIVREATALVGEW